MTHVDTLGTIVKIDGVEIKYISLDSIPIPDGDTPDKDTSTLGSGTVMEFGLGMFDPGSCEITGNYIAGDPGQEKLEEAFADRKLHAFEVNVVEAGTIFTYNAYVTKYIPGSEDNTFNFTANLRASGRFSKSTTYAGITSIVANAAGASVSPDVASSALPIDVNVIAVIVPTAISSTTLTVTAASASSLGISTDYGKNFVTLTSGSPSATIQLGAAGTLKNDVYVKVTETDKAARYVKVLIIRE